MKRAAVLTAFALVALASPAAAACKLVKGLELPVASARGSPLVTVTVNGKEVPVLADSGAFFSMLSPDAAAATGLILGDLPPALRVRGIGGEDRSVRMGVAKRFSIGGAEAKNVDFLVGGPQFSSGAQGLLGQNILRASDIEYDLASGMIRLWTSEDCAGVTLAYWDQTGAGVLGLDATTAADPHLQGAVFINGVRLKATFDTGAQTTLLTRKAAARAGVTPGAPGVVPAGHAAGLGGALREAWIASFDTVAIGEETIRNSRIRFADFSIGDSDILVGADFFRSHRVFVSTSQRKLYFTHNGGPVFEPGG